MIRPDERGPLVEALIALDQGDSRRFCDVMWLGMGDRWRDVLQALAQGMYVRILDPDAADGIEITERGSALAGDLGKELRRSA